VGAWRRAAIKVALLVGGLVVAGLLLEAGVLLTLGEQVKFPRRVVGAPFGLRINEPNARYRHQSPDVTVWFRINAQGMRADRDYPYEKPPGVRRIVSLGDSFTAGYEVDLKDTFSAVLERELRAQGVRVEVLNAGVSGYSTAEEYLYLERELLRYSPDLVLVNFYGNDLEDNVRTGLFALQDGLLRQTGSSYVPAGRLGNFLNTNVVFNFLSERSNAFARAKEAATTLLKRQIVEANERNLAANAGQPGGGRTADAEVAYRRRLTAALFERLYAATRSRGIPLVIQSIPFEAWKPYRLVEMFPLAEFDVHRPGLAFVSAKEVLDPSVGRELLYWRRSDGHWTPYASAASGRALADVIRRERLLPANEAGG
jgi:lysophospholipase L1-like esterase